MTCSRIIITEKQRPVTAGRQIFSKHFKVVMSTIDATDERMIEMRGAFTTGNAEYDRQAAHRPTSVWRTISEMVEGYLTGVEFTLYNGLKDAEKINKIIQEHLSDCEHYHRYVLGGLKKEKKEITSERLAELKQLDEFGKYIYNKVKRFGNLEAPTENVYNGKDFRPLLSEGGVAPNSGENLPDYVPIEERISYGALGKRKRYR